MTGVLSVVMGVVFLGTSAPGLATATGTDLEAPRPDELQAALARTTPELLQAAIARTKQRLMDNLAYHAELEQCQQALRAAKAAAPQHDQLSIIAARILLPISRQLQLDMAAMHASIIKRRRRARRRAARHAQQHLKVTGELLRRRWRAVVQIKRARRAAQAADRAAQYQDQDHAARVQAMLHEAQTLRHLAHDTQRLTNTILASRRPPSPGGAAARLFRWLRRLSARLSAVTVKAADRLSSWWARLADRVSSATSRTAGLLCSWTSRLSHYISAAAGGAASFLPSWRPRLAQLFHRDALTQAGAEGQQHQNRAEDAPVEQEAASLPSKALKWLSFENPWCRTLGLLVLHVAVCLATSIARLRVHHNYCRPEFLFDHRHAD